MTQVQTKRFQVNDAHEWLELAYEKGWTDGLPVMPPTPSKVEEIINHLRMPAQEVIGVLAPKNGVATAEKIAINCVMAGCKPEYVPVVIAAVRAMLHERFNLNGVQATTHSVAPLVIVNGPAIKALGFNAGDGVFAGGSRANATIGRAVRLILWNIGGGIYGDIDKATLGHPGKYSYCIAENQEESPWEPQHVTKGFAQDQSVVTVFGCEAPHNALVIGRNPEPIPMLNVIADTMSAMGNNNMHLGGGEILAVIGPRTADALATAGWSKRDVRKYLYDHARRTLADLSTGCYSFEHGHPHFPKWMNQSDPQARKPVVWEEEDIHVIVAGGKQGQWWCAVCPGWGELGGFAQWEVIDWPVGSPLHR